MKTKNLMDALLAELDRTKEILSMYEEIPTGAFGAMMIRREREFAQKAITDGDTVAMIQAYNKLREVQ